MELEAQKLIFETHRRHQLAMVQSATNDMAKKKEEIDRAESQARDRRAAEAKKLQDQIDKQKALEVNRRVLNKE